MSERITRRDLLGQGIGVLAVPLAALVSNACSSGEPGSSEAQSYSGEITALPPKSRDEIIRRLRDAYGINAPAQTIATFILGLPILGDTTTNTRAVFTVVPRAVNDPQEERNRVFYADYIVMRGTAVAIVSKPVELLAANVDGEIVWCIPAKSGASCGRTVLSYDGRGQTLTYYPRAPRQEEPSYQGTPIQVPFSRLPDQGQSLLVRPSSSR